MPQEIRAYTLIITQSLGIETGALAPGISSGEARLGIHRTTLRGDYAPERYNPCSNPKRPYLWANDYDSRRILVVRPNCKQWSCPECSQRNRRRWATRVYQGMNEYAADGRAWWLATLTLLGGKRSLDRQVYIWRSAWPKLYHRMKRHTRKLGNPELHYAIAPELSPEEGRMHCHMLLNDSLGATPTGRKKDPYISSWLKDNCAEVGLGYMADIRPMPNSKIGSWYMSKYVGKALGVEDWPKYLQRIRVSNKWPELKTEESIASDLNWNIALGSTISEIIMNFWSVGFDAVNLNTGELIEIVDLMGDVQ